MSGSSNILETANAHEKGRNRESYRVSFQGEVGAYSQGAVYSFFGRENVREVVPLPTFRSVFHSLSQINDKVDENENRHRTNVVDFAVVPIENSLAGSVGETLDLLLSSNVRIIGEVSIPISHALMAKKGGSIAQIARVMSHPQAIAQCKAFLDARNWQQVAVYDTAGAAKMISEQGLEDTAAIASELAAEIYHLEILERDIEDDRSNQTRFVVIKESSNKEEEELQNVVLDPGAKFKTSILFSTKHRPGSLVEALSALSVRKINLTKIESRPMKSRPWEYYFFVDFEGHERDGTCADALAELETKTNELKILGSYRRRS
jgi:prephenate dehydratase